MVKIMFVCHGNICRSPMAECIMKDLLERAGLGERVFVASSATSTEEIYRGIGNPVYPPAKRELARHGISCEGKRAVQLQKTDYEMYSLFVAMDEQNLRNIARIFGDDPQHKVHKLMSFTGKNADVADPWYSGRFDVAYADILAGCEALLAVLQEKLASGEI